MKKIPPKGAYLIIILLIVVAVVIVAGILLYRYNSVKIPILSDVLTNKEKKTEEKLDPILQHNLDEALDAIKTLEELGLE